MPAQLAQGKDMIQAIDKAVGYIEVAVIVLCLGSAAALSVFQVASRYLFNTSISSLEEIAVYCVVVSVFLGMSRADRFRQNVTVDILHKALPERFADLLWRISDIILCGVALVLAYYTAAAVQFSHMIGEISVSSLGASIWPIMAVIPVAFILVGLRAGARAIGLLNAQTEPDTARSVE